MDPHPDRTFYDLIEWVWVPLSATVGWLWLHMTGRFRETTSVLDAHRADTDKRVALLEQSVLALNGKLDEFDTRRREDRQEIMKGLDKLEGRLSEHSKTLHEKLDKAINGH